MLDASLPVWTLDRDDRALRVRGGRIELTELECKAFGYLQDHAGCVVKRRDLERDVWGFAEGVESQTTAVTIRNIRKKIGPAGKQIIETVFGIGWRLHDPNARRLSPRFPTPLFPRPAELACLHQLFADGWRLLTVTGPGGAGKTRLAVAFVESLSMPSVFVELANAQDAADVERALLAAAGMAGGSLDALEMALAGQERVFLLDEAENVLPAVVDVLKHLHAHRVVVTSRRALGVRAEGVHRVRPLIGEEGAAFLAMQLRASRWNHVLQPELVDPLLRWVDGSPLALELLAAHPTPPATLLTRLQRGELPAPAMQTALQQSYDRLDPSQRDALHALALCEARVTETLVQDWLGEEGVVALHALAERSLLHREADGWRLLRTLRSFVRGQDVDDSAHQDRFDAWLVKHCREAERRIFTQPTAALDSLGPLVDDLLGAIPRLDEEGTVDLLWALYLYSYLRGPLTIQNQAVLLARVQAPSAALTNILAAYSGLEVDRKALLRDLERARPRDQVRALVVFGFSWLPQELSWIGGFAASLVPEPGDDLGQLHLRRLMLVFQPDPFAAAEALARDGASYPLLGWMIQHTVARIQSLRGEEIRACRSWENLVADLSDQRQSGTLLYAVYGYADTLATVDTARAIEVLLEGAELGIREGYGNTWAVGRPGLWLALLGHHDARRFLEHGARGPHRSTSLACEAVILAERARCGDAVAGERAGSLDLTDIVGVLGDGTSLRPLVEAMVAHSLGQPILRPPIATSAWRVWDQTRGEASAGVSDGVVFDP